MKRVIQTAILLALLIPFSNSYSQQVNGHWYGIGMLQNTQQYNSYLSEMILRQKGKQVWGELDYYFKDSLVKVTIRGLYDVQTRKLNIKPFPMIYYLSPSARNSIDATLSGSFTLLVSKTESVLSGSLQSDDDHKYTVPNINYRFTRSDDTTDLVMKDEPEIKKETVAAIATEVAPVADDEIAAVFKSRNKVFTKELELVGNSLRLELYDNGEIDGDIVSLFLNGKMILPKTMLTHRAVRLTIELDPTLEFNELSMFAENLGTKPPNTAALIVYDGKTRYETLLSSDLSKSAAIKLKKKI